MPKNTSSSDATDSALRATIVSKDTPAEHAQIVKQAFSVWDIFTSLPDHCNSDDFYSDLFRHILHVSHIKRGSVSCVFSVAPGLANYFKGLHGGAVAAIAERVSIAAARTIVAADTELFLGELGMSYLSAASENEVLVVDGSVVRSGRNLTVVETTFRIKETGKLVYTARATLYNMPAAKL